MNCIHDRSGVVWSTAWATIVLLLAVTPPRAEADGLKVPILYSTDLHHPHIDPDDHFDLATLFSMPEFDIRGIVLDCGAHQTKAPGSIPVLQMSHLAGRKVPFAVGLEKRLASPTDDGRRQRAPFQDAVAMILDVLRRSDQPVTIFTTGSVRDVAAAFNRDPELLRQKVDRLYINAGDAATVGPKRWNEYNVNLDRQAYLRIMQSGLPIYWCPCFDGGPWQRSSHGTYWKFTHRQVLDTAPGVLQNWFIFALTKPQDADPIDFLGTAPEPQVRERLWAINRNMWCTAPLLHAAGRQIYQRGPDDFVARQPKWAQQEGLADKAVEAYRFRPMRVTVEDTGSKIIRVRAELDPADPNGFVFSATDERYGRVLASCLKDLFARLGR